jgi:hypothetical protein
MTGERFVVEQTHEIQSLAKELEQFKCTLLDKFMAGGIIAKLPSSWIWNIIDKSFPFRISLGLFMC